MGRTCHTCTKCGNQTTFTQNRLYIKKGTPSRLVAIGWLCRCGHVDWD